MIQLLGTVFFNFTTGDALIQGLNAHQQDLVVWTPGRPGIDLLSDLEPARLRRGWPSVDLVAPAQPRVANRRHQHARLDLLRHLGNRRLRVPPSGGLLDAALDTAGTFLGAICFLIGAVWMMSGDATADEAA